MERKARVTLSVYSGRPDPEWDLVGEDLEFFFGTLEKMAPMSRTVEPSPSNQLGYRGFFVNYCDGSDHPQTLHVYDGKAGYEYAEWYFKPDHGLEDWLIEKASEKGYGDTIKKMRKTDED